MCSRQREQHVLHKALKHKRIQCGKETKEASVAEQANLEKRHKMKEGSRCTGQIGRSCRTW